MGNSETRRWLHDCGRLRLEIKSGDKDEVCEHSHQSQSARFTTTQISNKYFFYASKSSRKRARGGRVFMTFGCCAFIVHPFTVIERQYCDYLATNVFSSFQKHRKCKVLYLSHVDLIFLSKFRELRIYKELMIIS